MGSLNGRVALITGGARGQGACEARLFVAEGARVVIADIRAEEGATLATSLGDHAFFQPLDVSDEAAWTRAVEETLRRFGQLDILINNAGVFWKKSIEDCSPEDYMTMVRINQLGVFLGMRAVISAMRERGGSIVNISSTAGMRGALNTAAYTATKFAVRGMTKVAALEFAQYGVRVNSVHPGLIDTDMVREQLADEFLAAHAAATPLRRAGTSEDVARLVLFLASDASSFSTGSEFICDGGSLTG